MKLNILHILLYLFICSACNSEEKFSVDYVDPFIGTGFHGHTYPGATAPFGAVQLSPDTRVGNWDACAGYHYNDTTLMPSVNFRICTLTERGKRTRKRKAIVIQAIPTVQIPKRDLFAVWTATSFFS